MDLGARIFKWIASNKKDRTLRHFSNQKVLDLAGSADLDRLALVCCAFNEQEVRVHLTDGIETSDLGSLLLPSKLGLSNEEEKNFAVYLYRVMAFNGAIKDSLAVPQEFLSASEAFLKSAVVAPRIHRSLVGRFGGFTELLMQVNEVVLGASESFSSFDPTFREWGSLITKAISCDDFTLSDQEALALTKSWKGEWVRSPHCPLHAVAILPRSGRRSWGRGAAESEGGRVPSDRSALPVASNSKKQELQVKTVARPEVKDLSSSEENPLTHVFEKLLTAEEHKGGSKKQDGSDESELHADALQELTLDRVARTQASSDTLVKSNAEIESGVAEMDAPSVTAPEKVFCYPEWFRESRSYKEDFCKVYEGVVEPSPGVLGNKRSPQQKGLSQKLSAFLNESRWKPRQKDGPEFDLDAIVRWRSQVQGSGPVDQRVYMGRRRLERSLAVLILLDASLSTDSWVGDQRILDVMRDSLAILSGAFEGLDDRFSIATFNSYSREKCKFQWVKRFGDTWSSSQSRLFSVKPDGFTRIGPALRHAHAVLRNVKARRKLILLFSDAKPSDYDRYEGEHGMADVRKAVTEIKASGIFVRGIAVEQERRGNLARMFGVGQFKVLSNPNEIADKVLQIFTEMMGKQ